MNYTDDHLNGQPYGTELADGLARFFDFIGSLGFASFALTMAILAIALIFAK